MLEVSDGVLPRAKPLQTSESDAAARPDAAVEPRRADVAFAAAAGAGAPKVVCAGATEPANTGTPVVPVTTVPPPATPPVGPPPPPPPPLVAPGDWGERAGWRATPRLGLRVTLGSLNAGLLFGAALVGAGAPVTGAAAVLRSATWNDATFGRPDWAVPSAFVARTEYTPGVLGVATETLKAPFDVVVTVVAIPGPLMAIAVLRGKNDPDSVICSPGWYDAWLGTNCAWGLHAQAIAAGTSTSVNAARTTSPRFLPLEPCIGPSSRG